MCVCGLVLNFNRVKNNQLTHNYDNYNAKKKLRIKNLKVNNFNNPHSHKSVHSHHVLHFDIEVHQWVQVESFQVLGLYQVM